MERKIKRQEIYDGKVIHVVVDDVMLDDGSLSKREVVLHNGGACIALEDTDGKFFMVSQYRYALNEEMLEFCAGKLEKGEDPRDAVIRECHEELGYECKNLQALGYIVPTCGYCSEKIYLFYGQKGEYVGTHFDEDERIQSTKYPLSEIIKMIEENHIHDAKTIALANRLILLKNKDQKIIS